MGDYAIRMRFEIDAPRDTIEKALTTTDGIASWWSSRVEGSPSVDGGRLEVSFPDVGVPFDFTVRREGVLAWEVGENPEHWHGTTVRWEIAEDGDGSVLRFVHGGYDPENPVIEIVTPAWALIITRLKAYAETGTPQPFFDW